MRVNKISSLTLLQLFLLLSFFYSRKVGRPPELTSQVFSFLFFTSWKDCRQLTRLKTVKNHRQQLLPLSPLLHFLPAFLFHFQWREHAFLSLSSLYSATKLILMTPSCLRGDGFFSQRTMCGLALQRRCRCCGTRQSEWEGARARTHDRRPLCWKRPNDECAAAAAVASCSTALDWLVGEIFSVRCDSSWTAAAAAGRLLEQLRFGLNT